MQHLPFRRPSWFPGGALAHPGLTEPPLRGDLFTVEQLARHARGLSANQKLARPAPNQLLHRLAENEKILREFNRETLVVDQSRRVTPAAEWLLDNFYLIEEQVQMARRHLPRGYSRELPGLLDGSSAGLPRVYDLVLELISHVDAQIDAASLSAFVAAYQENCPLKLGELWAIPIMLRLGLIENLRRITNRLTIGRLDRNLADLWVSRLQEMAEKDPPGLIIVVADLARSNPNLSSSFVAEFCQRLSQQSPVLHLARNWLEQRLAEHGLSIEQLIHQESQNQAADQVSVRHSITSLRFLTATDWKEFVETLSLVDQTLRADPAKIYGQMDFATRDRYRHGVEALARHSQFSEPEIAQRVIALANDAARQISAEDRTAHVGFYLIGNGQTVLATAVKVHWPIRTLIEHAILRFPLIFYAGGIAGFTLLGTGLFLQEAHALGVRRWQLAGFTLIFLFCASQLAVALLNWLATLLVKPRLLPRLDFSAGIPDEFRTMVVVPTILSNAAGVDRLIETLEIHHLANRDNALHFALLTDFRDADHEVMPGDDDLLQQARLGVETLNKKYSPELPDRFFLFHRARRWNSSEGLWMGYERKRGKLTEFNLLLRGGPTEAFSEIVGDITLLPSIRYVITLDTDTQLPRETARQLVGTMAHPLNRPEFDPGRGIVSEGYGILQPRVGVSLPGAGRSWFARLFAGDAGIDPYTRAVSDVYQDIFREGSFIGKGIYDVGAFDRALTGRFPENTILSHDLLEACYARSGLVSDVELFEEYPSRYNVDMNRRHRWIRGDWQITQWLLPRVPGPDARRIATPLSGLSRWKIFDNLRRSLVPGALLLLLLGDWLLLPELAGLGTLLVLAIVLLPSLWTMVLGAFSIPHELPWTSHLRDVLGAAGRQFAQILLTIAFLPYDAFVSLDAIARTLARLLITQKRLLEWQTSSDTELSAHSDLQGFYRTMWITPALAVGTLLALIELQTNQFWLAAPFLALWLTAPWIAWLISQPIPAAPSNLDSKQLQFLRITSRKTWHYFENFVTAGENWLPPDNFQEVPTPIIASRTSPTNLGLALLGNLAARDFGYLSVGNLLQRTANTLGTMERLERHRGHFYNWYDTRSLQPLLPRYVSSVDSGNLAGHLLTLGAGLRELPDEEIFSAQAFAGLTDTVNVLVSLGSEHPGLARLTQVLSGATPTLSASWAQLVEATTQASALATALAHESDEIKHWAEVLRKDCQDHRDDLLFLAPWLALPVPPSPEQKLAEFDRIPSLRELAAREESIVPPEAGASGDSANGQAALSLAPDLGTEEFLHCIRESSARARQRCATLAHLAEQSDAFAWMDFTFLRDPARDLLSIGYNVTDHRLDISAFDLLASEARLCSYVAIAQGQVPQDHWFALGRLLVPSSIGPILVSWSGSMFEYLMPMLVMPSYENTLLDRTCAAAVARQIEYGQSRGIPWGISESGYNRTDAAQNYQYRAFGVPGLGLKRGLAEDLVIAPYASAMALMVAPRAACENLQRLAKEGRAGAYGFYEAVDYTRSRLPPGEASVTIRSFMVHHQGMSLLALLYLLRDRPMQRRFMSCALFQATDLLLQERIPKAVATVFSAELEPKEPRASPPGENAMRICPDPSTRAPEVHLLSNGRYHVAISSAGGGYSRWQDLAITRWREDATRDCWGTFVYLRDTDSGEFWSASYQPTQKLTKPYEAIFTSARAEFRERQSGIEVHTEISVSPEDDVELRRIKLTNHSPTKRTIELTSYAEVVLASRGADAAHPAFSNLFVQTEFVPRSSAILCTRRPRSADERPPWLLHLMVTSVETAGEISCETDRSRFVGRGGNLVRPAALQTVTPLSNTTGSVLDPIISLRRYVTIEPNLSVVVSLITGATKDRETAETLVEKYQTARMADRAFDLAWTHAQVTLRHLNVSEAEAQHYGRLAGALIYANPARRAGAQVLAGNRRGQNGLWSYGISGDAPLVFLQISDVDKIEIVRQLIQAHAYWRNKGLIAELLIVNEDVSIYRQSLHDQIVSLIASGVEAQMLDKPGGIFVRRLEQIPQEDRILLQSAARVVLDDERGTLAEQLDQRNFAEPVLAPLNPTRVASVETPKPPPTRDLIFQNGLGGFTRDGHEYVITLAAGQMTPAPWVNVLANPSFGTVVSESGSAYTWVENSHEFRLTPWHNDPVQDPSGECLYIRDEQTGHFWSPTPLPARGATPYVIRHGFGYTVFEHVEQGIASELWVYVAMDAPVKFSVLKLRNESGRSRRLSVTGYWEWVLGDLRERNLLSVQTEVDLRTGALLGRNRYNTEFTDRIAYVDVNDSSRTLTGDRREFIGRNGSLTRPAALKRARLSGKVGAGLDPCGAVQVSFDLTAGQERETSFRLGVGRSSADVQALIQRFRQPEASRSALEAVWAYWNRALGAVNVDTPDPAVNVMANGWLLYQTLSCRLWGRTGFYQSGGAYGFRDQLQDSMALVHAEPTLTREHLLRAAAHQFREGDVQHWWHPPAGRGVRTHFSDDFLWLPYVTCRYVTCLADTGVLDEKLPFLEGRPVKPEEEAYYDLPGRAEETGTLYQHCVRAIERGLKFGEHGLPLIGCGDWNDGMNLVGQKGRGESVWLAFFLYDVLTQFGRLARSRGDVTFADHCLDEAQRLQGNIERHAWDGEWYRRAYFDDGEALGSKENAECQIDSLPQSWSIISGAGETGRSHQAMRAVEQRLVRMDSQLIQLFDPPFDKSSLNPGYIKGYIPGVRENGGQYTHGAIWTVMALALMGENDRAWELFGLLNPVNHGGTASQIATYKVEPYVVAADVYALAPHIGRGGWTWYTGSAGWMYRLVVETLLGVNLEGNRLRLQPRLPKEWPSFKIHYRYRQTVYHITIVRLAANSTDSPTLVVDAQKQEGVTFPLVDDRKEHFVEMKVH